MKEGPGSVFQDNLSGLLNLSFHGFSDGYGEVLGEGFPVVRNV